MYTWKSRIYPNLVPRENFQKFSPISSYTLILSGRSISFRFFECVNRFWGFKNFERRKNGTCNGEIGWFQPTETSLFGDFLAILSRNFRMFTKILQKYDCENPTKMGKSQKIWQKTPFYEIFGYPNDILNSELWEKNIYKYWKLGRF